MSDAVGKRLASQLAANGSAFAEIEDSVKAVMRVAADQSVNGKIVRRVS